MSVTRARFNLRAQLQLLRLLLPDLLIRLPELPLEGPDALRRFLQRV